jgi:hypothetical protein
MTTIICGFAGAVLRTTIKKAGTIFDISSASLMQVRIFRPDGTTTTGTAGFHTDGTDGMVSYTTVATDTAPGGTEVPGPYRFRFRVVDASNALDGWFDDHQFTAELNL